ncbi:MAG: glycosyltransferase [Hyphomicrobiaceae bacterium]
MARRRTLEATLAEGRKPTIMFVTLSLDVGGAERHLASITPELARRGFDVKIYCLNRQGAYGDAVRAGGVDVIGPIVAADGRMTSRSRRMLLSGLATVKYLSILVRHRPHIVHFFLPEAYLFGAPPAILASIPIRIMSRRGLNLHFSRWRGLRKLESMLHQRMTAVLGNSRRVVADLLDEGCPRNRLGLIYNGTDLTAFDADLDRAAMRHSLGVGPEDLMAVMVANLITYKGHFDLFRALALAKPRLARPVKIILAGRDDGIQAELTAEAKRLGISENVSFLGLRSDVAAILKAADIGLLTSHEEGFANAVIEGMAAGLPMLVTDVGGNAEAVLDGVNGLVVPARSPEPLAEALVRLAGDDDLRARFGAKSRARAEQHFTLEACVDRYQAFYMGLCQGRLPGDIVEVSLDA